jgi:hypothetical protein
MVVTGGPGVQHSSPKKNHLIGAIQADKNVAQSACLVGIPYGTVLDLLEKYKTTSSTKNLPHSGCPRKVTDHTKQQIVRTTVKVLISSTLPCTYSTHSN